MNGLLYCGVQILANCRVLSRIETNRKIKETGQQIENILIFFKPERDQKYGNGV